MSTRAPSLIAPAGTDPAPALTRATQPRYRASNAAVPYAFLAPAILLFVAFLAAPIFYSLYLSFRAAKVKGLGLGSGSRTEQWVGMENYVRSVADPEFLASVGRVALYGLIVVPTMLGLALLFALLLDSGRTRVGGFSRTAIFLPYAVPAVVASLLWGFLYLPRVSPVVDVLGLVGVSAPNVMSSQLIMFAVANIAVWGGTGFNMIVLYTALKSIPSDIYEAARLDGASDVQIALRIKIPIVVPSMIMTFVFSLIATLQVFAEPMTLRPLSNTISTTWTPLMKVYRDAFVRNDVYSAAATSVLIALATFVLSFGFLKLVGSRAFNQEK
ncbi:multiple sugar transport system permease protein [Kineococcus xinjiangensis]|uniref:Multiple sugar transport system permease protein n=1 Tax=Kineococcus xinjiangensis TaxID=512762 RepID=A0A2S6IVN0_9ACTN|nr:sugar ABC transporter permease [Kineococcus xinjiangensis]PPK98419.1 multiple sugar transport system permease protein [Kineococcus xinjiangensis]